MWTCYHVVHAGEYRKATDVRHCDGFVASRLLCRRRLRFVCRMQQHAADQIFWFSFLTGLTEEYTTFGIHIHLFVLSLIQKQNKPSTYVGNLCQMIHVLYVLLWTWLGYKTFHCPKTQRASRALCFLSRPRSGVESNLFSSLPLTLDKSFGFSVGDKRKAKTMNLLAGGWPINAWRYAEHQHNIQLGLACYAQSWAETLVSRRQSTEEYTTYGMYLCFSHETKTKQANMYRICCKWFIFCIFILWTCLWV